MYQSITINICEDNADDGRSKLAKRCIYTKSNNIPVVDRVGTGRLLIDYVETDMFPIYKLVVVIGNMDIRC